MTRSRERHVPRTLSWKGLALTALGLSSAGCFSYVPAELETTPPGQGVRVLVTRQGAAELAQISDVVGSAPILDGTVVGVEGRELLLLVPVAQRQVGFMTTNLNQTIRIPTSEIVSFERREFDKFGTAFVLGGVVGAVTAIVVFIVKPRGAGNSDPEDPPDDLRLNLSLFSFPIGR